MPPKKTRKPGKGEGDNAPPVVLDLASRIFLYLQPKNIIYPQDEENVTVEIELKHPTMVITALKDHYTPENIIYLEEFQMDNPTFSVTIKQDDIDDVNKLSDTPLTLTLHENVAHRLIKDTESEDISRQNIANEEALEEEGEEEEEIIIIERRTVAQGHIDLLEFFTKERSFSTCTTFLYPLPMSPHRMSCKIEWDIYSLHPLTKNLIFSNVVFFKLGSIYNLEEPQMEECENLILNVSFLSTVANEKGEFSKVLLCSYKGFEKQIIADQVLDHKWENLKDPDLENLQSMGIRTDTKWNGHKLFADLLSTYDAELNMDDIDPTNEYALVGNTLHRYVLTDKMEKLLENSLYDNEQHILIELIQERDMESTVILQGFVELAVFLFPEVTNCTFAIELRPPGYKRPSLPKPADQLKAKKPKGKDTKRQSATTQDIPKEKVPFLTLKICLHKPITEPAQDMILKSETEITNRIFSKCPEASKLSIPMNIVDVCEESYRSFDETINNIIDYILRKQIKTIEDDQQFFCSQIGNLSNKIIRLIACDFNLRIKTETNIEFTNLMTVVYGELMQRIYDLLIKCSSKSIEDCLINTEEDRLHIINFFEIIKYMNEVGNLEMAKFFMGRLNEQYENHSILAFYRFLNNIEELDFTSAREYLKKPLNQKDMVGEPFLEIIKAYINFQEDFILENDEKLEDDERPNALENLLKSLLKMSSCNPSNIATWILLFCIYKKHNYFAGMEYCRWKYENLYKQPIVEIPLIPISRWEIYMAHKIEYKSVKCQHFYKQVNIFLNLGLYQFAECIFNEIQDEAMEVEKYFMTNTFKIFLNKLEPKFATKNFPVEKYLNPLYLRCTLSQVNGNLEYFRNPTLPNAMKHYSIICNIKDLPDYAHFHLGLFRYAFRMMEEEDFYSAKEAFSLCCSDHGNGMVAQVGKAKACYWLNDLEGAEQAFAEGTQYRVHIPNIWAYLALINLRKGENYRALECWKYARLNPNDEINMEIIQELSKIDYDDVDLYIDIPEKRG